MRFDDSLRTVLAADASTVFGATSVWRQLVDLMGRGRVAESEASLERLRALRPQVPESVRAASGRALALVRPGAGMVALFAVDELAVAAPVLRTATLDAAAWAALLPRLTPAARSVLRHRRDLPDEVQRALDSFGSVDFVLGFDGVADAAQADAVPAPPAPTAPANDEVVPPPAAPLGPTPFVSLGRVALGLPVVAEALRQSEVDEASPASSGEPPRFEIADLVARIDAFHRQRETPAPVPVPASLAPAARFAWETDAAGVIRWVEGTARPPVIGLALGAAHAFDGTVAGAFRGRASFKDARLSIGGLSEAAGSWRVSGVPMFDRATGRFIGFRGTARRPRADESATPTRATAPAADALRQLVHELRTPTNAIAGFAELIESELLGAVPPVYRERAATIREHAADLVAAIDDLDLAARIESRALDLRTGRVVLAPVLRRVAGDLASLARLRGAKLALAPFDETLVLRTDDRATERLLGRLLAALVSCALPGERIGVTVTRDGDEGVAIAVDRPAGLAAITEGGVLSIDAEVEAELPGAPLLGTGFALRLAHNLAAELGGGLVIGQERLTLRLPAASIGDMGQASTS